MTPSRADYADARLRHLAATGEMVPVVITIGGVDYEAAGSVSGEGYAIGPGGAMEIAQQAVFHLAKARHPARPTRGAVVQVGTQRFTVDLIGGDNLYDRHWSLRCSRVPGGE